MRGVVRLEGAKLITNLLGLYTCVFCSRWLPETVVLNYSACFCMIKVVRNRNNIVSSTVFCTGWQGKQVQR